MPEEAAPVVGQDPVQTPATPAAPVAQVPPAPPQQNPGPWANDLATRFDPETAAKVDAYLRESVQPRMTQYEQQLAASRDAQQLYDLYTNDAEAANISVNRQLYGDDYADQLAASVGRVDMIQNPAVAQQVQAQQLAATQQAQAPQEGQVPTEPAHDENWEYWNNKRQQEEYDTAVTTFLQDPQYADIDRNLFDPFVGAAETWDEAVASYRNYAAQFRAQAAPADPAAPVAPPTLGSEAVGAPGNTASLPKETLSEAIDGIFGEQQPMAPPVMSQ